MIRSVYSGIYDPEKSPFRYIEDAVRSSLTNRGVGGSNAGSGNGSSSSAAGRSSPTGRARGAQETDVETQAMMEATAFDHELLPAEFDALYVIFSLSFCSCIRLLCYIMRLCLMPCLRSSRGPLTHVLTF